MTPRHAGTTFTNTKILLAILESHKRGVNVAVILDSSLRGSKYSSSDFFTNQGVPTYIDPAHGIAHSKIILVDDTTTITGSYNFTNAAEDSNEENLLMIKNMPDLFAAYLAHFDEHFERAKQYHGKMNDPIAPTTE